MRGQNNERDKDKKLKRLEKLLIEKLRSVIKILKRSKIALIVLKNLNA